MLIVNLFTSFILYQVTTVEGQQIDCASGPCENGAICEDTNSGYQCFCVDGYAGETCELNFDDCTSSPCRNNAQCVDGVATYTCLCAVGFTDRDCQTNIDECVSNHCLQNGTCIDLVNGFVCECVPPFWGGNCALLPCDTTPCENEAQCRNDVKFNQSLVGFVCDCITGFAGPRCEINLEDCDIETCSGNGLCVDGVNDYRCLCEPGWVGITCGSPVDDCIGSACKNNAACTDLHLGYACSCISGYEGSLCERDRDECSTWQPCKNEAMCVDLFDDYRCECRNGWTGVNCTDEVDECENNTCQNAAECLDVIGGFFCRCPPFYTGLLCETLYNPCAPEYNPCQNEAKCIVPPDGQYRCFCPTGFTGVHCEVNVNECLSLPCENNATCEDITAGYLCHCTLGWEGQNCLHNIDECASQPCLNGADCLDLIGGFECNCTREYQGLLCHEVVDFCVQKPCSHDSMCVNFVGGYACLCSPPYTGQHCLDLIDACQSSPCINNGTCMNTVHGFLCNCPLPHTGHTCSDRVDFCESEPCFLGTCVSLPDDFVCACPQYITGKQCTDLVDYCSNSPCENEGNCINGEFKFRCVCSYGFTGETCTQMIDFCIEEPCQNNANCSNIPGGFKCSCAAEFTGDLCQNAMPTVISSSQAFEASLLSVTTSSQVPIFSSEYSVFDSVSSIISSATSGTSVAMTVSETALIKPSSVGIEPSSVTDHISYTSSTVQSVEPSSVTDHISYTSSTVQSVEPSSVTDHISYTSSTVQSVEPSSVTDHISHTSSTVQSVEPSSVTDHISHTSSTVQSVEASSVTDHISHTSSTVQSVEPSSVTDHISHTSSTVQSVEPSSVTDHISHTSSTVQSVEASSVTDHISHTSSTVQSVEPSSVTDHISHTSSTVQSVEPSSVTDHISHTSNTVQYVEVSTLDGSQTSSTISADLSVSPSIAHSKTSSVPILSPSVRISSLAMDSTSSGVMIVSPSVLVSSVTMESRTSSVMIVSPSVRASSVTLDNRTSGVMIVSPSVRVSSLTMYSTTSSVHASSLTMDSKTSIATILYTSFRTSSLTMETEYTSFSKPLSLISTSAEIMSSAYIHVSTLSSFGTISYLTSDYPLEKSGTLVPLSLVSLRSSKTDVSASLTGTDGIITKTTNIFTTLDLLSEKVSTVSAKTDILSSSVDTQAILEQSSPVTTISTMIYSSLPTSAMEMLPTRVLSSTIESLPFTDQSSLHTDISSILLSYVSVLTEYSIASILISSNSVVEASTDATSMHLAKTLDSYISDTMQTLYLLSTPYSNELPSSQISSSTSTMTDLQISPTRSSLYIISTSVELSTSSTSSNMLSLMDSSLSGSEVIASLSSSDVLSETSSDSTYGLTSAITLRTSLTEIIPTFLSTLETSSIPFSTSPFHKPSTSVSVQPTNSANIATPWLSTAPRDSSTTVDTNRTASQVSDLYSNTLSRDGSISSSISEVVIQTSSYDPSKFTSLTNTMVSHSTVIPSSATSIISETSSLNSSLVQSYVVYRTSDTLVSSDAFPETSSIVISRAESIHSFQTSSIEASLSRARLSSTYKMTSEIAGTRVIPSLSYDASFEQSSMTIPISSTYIYLSATFSMQSSNDDVYSSHTQSVTSQLESDVSFFSTKPAKEETEFTTGTGTIASLSYSYKQSSVVKTTDGFSPSQTIVESSKLVGTLSDSSPVSTFVSSYAISSLVYSMLTIADHISSQSLYSISNHLTTSYHVRLETDSTFYDTKSQPASTIINESSNNTPLESTPVLTVMISSVSSVAYTEITVTPSSEFNSDTKVTVPGILHSSWTTTLQLPSVSFTLPTSSTVISSTAHYMSLDTSSLSLTTTSTVSLATISTVSLAMTSTVTSSTATVQPTSVPLSSAISTTTTSAPSTSCDNFICYNGGMCREDVSGLFCDCTEEYLGPKCDRVPSVCNGYECDNGGVCVITFTIYDVQVPTCNCHLPYTGSRCEMEKLIYYPAFVGSSYMVFHPPAISSNQRNEIYISVKSTQSDGTILSSANQDGDYKLAAYITLYLANGRLHYQFSCDGATHGNVVSDITVNTGDVYEIIIRQMWAAGPGEWCSAAMEVNSQVFVSTPLLSIKQSQHLGQLYIGGIPRYTYQKDRVYSTHILDGFVGCVHNLQINQQEIDLVTSAIDGINIENCNVPVCQHDPCRNGAACHSSGEEWYCICLPGYGGALCERALCDVNPCQHGGTCIILEEEQDQLCLCAYGRGGALCERALSISLPHFTGDQYGHTSYIAYDHPHYLEDDFEVEFSMIVDNSSLDSSVIMFLGNTGSYDGRRDFMAVGIERGFIVLKFDLGSGYAQIFSSESLDTSLHQHVVKLGRNRYRGWVQVNNQRNVTGRSPGILTALNTNSKLYIGGIEMSDVGILPSGASFADGFQGCIFNMKVKSHITDFIDPGSPPGHVIQGRNIGQCSSISCDHIPCQNGAECRDLGASIYCVCVEDWKGTFCTDELTVCDRANACSIGSLCVPDLSGGYVCLCTLGKSGDHCNQDMNISDPQFHGEGSFMSLEPVYIKRQMDITLQIKPNSMEGLLFYVAQRLHSHAGDFLSITLNDGKVELRMNLGTGVNVVQSDVEVAENTGAWYTVEAGRNLTHSYVSVDGHTNIAVLTGVMSFLDTTTHFYIGGIPNLDDVSPEAFEHSPTAYQGCFREVVVNGKHYELNEKGAQSGRQITDCDNTTCGYSVCRNAGDCTVTTDGYSCSCTEAFVGSMCEVPVQCANHSCMNGECRADTEGYECDCVLGWKGQLCDEEVAVNTTIELTSRSFAYVVDRHYHGSNKSHTDISFQFMTTSLLCLIFWNGQTYTDDDDYLGVGIQDGRLKLVWNLGWYSRGEIASTIKFNDGNWHHVYIRRLDQTMSLEVDGFSYESRVSGDFHHLDTLGQYFIGSFKSGNVKEMTLGYFAESFNGCLRDLKIGKDSPAGFNTVDAGINITPCSYS